jgi:thioredoxin-related protein
MTQKCEVKWLDIVSPKVDAETYINTVILPAKSELSKNFENYSPVTTIIDKIKEIIKNKNEKFMIVAFGASWCPDCNRNIPRTMKIYSAIKDPGFSVYYIGGIKTKPLAQRQPGTYVWAVPPSPVETNDPKFDIQKIPTFFIFDKQGNCIGKIVIAKK